MSNYISLHTHTEFSILDGFGQVDAYVERAKALRMPALAMTDHGNICGAPSFYTACRKAGIEPIIGEEFYFTTDTAKHKEKMRGKKEPKEDTGYVDKDDDGQGRYHFIALAKGDHGYRVLSELSAEAHRNFYGKPLVDRAMVEQLSERDRDQLVILSGCAASVISKAVLAGDLDRAKENTLWWREMFPHFYMELQHHGTAFDRKLNRRLLWLANRFGIEHVVTNDPHYVMKEDCDSHDALLAIQTASDIDDPNRFSFDGSGYHLRSYKEMERAFRAYAQEVFAPGARATHLIAKQCRTRIPEWESRTWHIPRFPDSDDPTADLRRRTVRGLRQRGLHRSRAYVDRAKYELSVFKEVEIEDFMLITIDFVEEAARRGIRVGAGRGSVCGSLVGFLTGIHKIDPIRYELRFDRFLNPARPKMPDVDTDFMQSRRGEMFDYAEEKYGKENVVNVCAYQRMRMRAAFQSLASAYGISFQERLRVSKQMSNDDEIEDVLPAEIQEQHPDLAAQLFKLKDTKKAISAHPAGIVIADPRDQIRKLVPEMYIASSERFVGQYDLDAIEMMGLLKEDFLGLRTLDTIEECVNLIEKRTGERIDPDLWVPDEEEDDDKIYKMLAQGNCDGVFQMEGPVNRRGCLEVKPREFEDIVSITSLYRTGPISAGYPKQFNANRKKGKRTIRYAHPLLKPILEATWGVILYQEQVMDIGEHLAGFDAAQVDDIKEAIKHKKSKMMDQLRPVFVEGCRRTNRIPERISTAIWKDIEGYSGYSYNRSHAVAYSMTTYQTARLKYLWPLEFYSALLRTCPTTSQEGKAKKEGYLKSVSRLGYAILPPDINISESGVTPDHRANAVRFGLTDIKGVGDAAYAKILAGRQNGPYGSIEAVSEAVRNTGTMTALEACSALDSIGGQSSKRATNELCGWDFHDDMVKWRRKYRRSLRLPEDRKAPVTVVGKITRILLRETKNGKPYVTWTLKHSPSESFSVRLWSETKKLWALKEGSIVLVHGEWEPQWENISIGGTRDIKVLREVL